MKLRLALTPALSPRRGSANVSQGFENSRSAFETAATALEDFVDRDAPAALPLLGERAGVRAGQSKTNIISARRGSRAFTLIELLLVMAMLLIVLAVSFPSLRGFFHGRNLDSEARRFLVLTKYAQSRAVSEGFPMVLWIDEKQGTYGMQAQTGYLDEDDKSVEFEVDESLEIEVVRPMLTQTATTQRNETTSVVGNLPAIRFTPDGFYSDSSPDRVMIRQGDEEEVWIAKSDNRLSYEIQTSNQQLTRR